jgi:hypothetical protein
MTKRSDTLKQSIFAAFELIDRPATLIGSHGYDGSHVEKFWGARDRYDLTADSIRKGYSGTDAFALLLLLEPKAYQYFLPACMIMTLGDKSADYYAEMTNATLNTLTPPWCENSQPSLGKIKTFVDRFNSFTNEQNIVTAAFLRYTSRTLGNFLGPNQSQKALKHYWKQFL